MASVLALPKEEAYPRSRSERDSGPFELSAQGYPQWESTIYRPVPEEFLKMVVSESLKLPAYVWRDYMEGAVLSINQDYVVELREINMPTLILWGEQDALFPREEQERLAEAIPSATLKVYLESGHAVHWERPEQVVRDLEVFMKDTRPAR